MRKRFAVVLVLLSLTVSPYLAWGDATGTSTAATLFLFFYTAGVSSSGITGTTDETEGEEEQAYLRQNHVDVIEGLASGQGQFIDDLTFALNIPHHKRHIFTQKLTAQFAVLIDLVDEERITPSRAKQFFNVIVKIRSQV